MHRWTDTLRRAMSSKGIALVTGAAQGIGRSIALRLADDGFDVAVNDISSNSGKLDAVVDEIQRKGRASSNHVADVSQDDQVKGMVEEVVERHGGLDVMIANAGVLGNFLLITELSAEEWDRVMNVNAKGPFLCYKYAGIQMVKQGRGGRIIGASSVAGKQGAGTQAPYVSSKFAVRGLTQAAAQEFGPHGITVNAYAPGAIDTPMINSAIIDQYTKMSPLKKIGVPEDIADLVSFLVSKGSRFITGQTISINGGVFFD
ncbi:NAD-binding protein [Mycena galopus ATCC 62051]|nr:NAD-binding protein [Mycena galopus ATCC 62051]